MAETKTKRRKMKNKEHETFELTEDMFANWDKENEKWYKKAKPLIDVGNMIQNVVYVRFFYKKLQKNWIK